VSRTSRASYSPVPRADYAVSMRGFASSARVQCAMASTAPGQAALGRSFRLALFSTVPQHRGQHGAIVTRHCQTRAAHGTRRQPVHIRRLHGLRRVPVARDFRFGAKTSQTDSATSARRVRGSAPSYCTLHAQHLPLVAETRLCEKCLAPAARAIRPRRGSATQSLCAPLRHLHVLSTPWRALPRVRLRLADRSNSRAIRPFRNIAANAGLSTHAVAKHEPHTIPDVGRCTSAVSTVLGGCRSRAISFFVRKCRRRI
jgi:hypothetical protein